MLFSIRGFLLSFIFLLAAISLSAQNPRGALVGTVQDPTGARVASAKIEIKAVDSSVDRTTITDDQGQFRMEDLLPGPYHLIVNARGFAEANSDVTVSVSTAQNVSVTLRVATSQSTVNVQGVASSITTSPLDTTSAVHQGVVTAYDLDTIPLAARSFANIAYLVAGTEPVEPSDPTKARITAVSTGGSSGLNKSTFRRWRRRFRRLHWRISAEFFAGCNSRIRIQDGRRRRGYRRHDCRSRGDHHQARHRSSGTGLRHFTNAMRR